MRSASLPGTTVPISSSRPRSRAAALVAAVMAAIGDAPWSWSSTISRQTMSAVTPTSPVSVPVAIGMPSSMAASHEARCRRSMRSCRSRWTGVSPGRVRFTSVTTSVGTRNAPDAASASIAARSASHACSTLSTPARAEATTEADPCAWLMTRTPSVRASATIAVISASVSSGSPWTIRPGASPVGREHRRLRGDDLDDIAPLRTCRRTAATSWVVPSASIPNWWPWPPLIPIARPAATSRGPGRRPAAMASRRTNSRLRMEPAPRAVVTPARRARAAWPAAARTISASERRAIVAIEPSVGSKV